MTNAHAVLGEHVASVHGDQIAFGGFRRIAQVGTVQTHTIVSDDGSVVRQFVAPGGHVVAVAWDTRYKPRLDQLLGAHFANYLGASRAATATGGMVRRSVVQRGDLVVESASNVGGYRGRAYLRSSLATISGVQIDAAR
jgi:hypothetical protein